ncbi:glycoside hydrolase family 43 protein [Schlesneria paludicola]|uniref:glycoside hydrolase family 43 protein n=1 Tax=Schlesneria paludicola TaxID=360056 RepID=UPI00029ABB2E|nr:glycoside hydrolase family 43 protein [Schlesneria paludicola]
MRAYQYHRDLFLFFVALPALMCSQQAAHCDDATGDCYVFSYFHGNGEDGLHLASSCDGLVWEPINDDKSLTTPTVGGKLMRDPSIVQGPDGRFHMVWSSGWWDMGFGYASSQDLIQWGEHRFIPVTHDTPSAKNNWAPDLFYDAENQQFVVTLATTIPGKFPETDQDGDHNHRLYWLLTKDFVTFSAPTIAFNPGYNSIDGTIVAMNGGLTMIYKDERPGHKRLHAVTSAGIGKPWSVPGPPILTRDWVEGPTVLKTGNVWRLYFDCYRDGHFGAAESKDGVQWTDITDTLKMPKGVRHGTALTVNSEIFEKLLKLKK